MAKKDTLFDCLPEGGTILKMTQKIDGKKVCIDMTSIEPFNYEILKHTASQMIDALQKYKGDWDEWHKKRKPATKNYGEIYFMGVCNCSCFYCIGKEISASTSQEQVTMSTPPRELRNFNKFIEELHQRKITTVYLSSVKTDPLLYKHLDTMVDILHEEGFKVGIRTNGYDFWKNKRVFKKLDEEISFSVQALDEEKNFRICHRTYTPSWGAIVQWLRENGKRCRFTMVLNRYNEGELQKLLDFSAANSDVVEYVQARRLYKELELSPAEDETVFQLEHSRIQEKCGEPYACFGQSPCYWWRNGDKKVSVSFWSKPFEKDTINSVNYFVTGEITTACKIVRGKNFHEEEIVS